MNYLQLINDCLHYLSKTNIPNEINARTYGAKKEHFEALFPVSNVRSTKCRNMVSKLVRNMLNADRNRRYFTCFIKYLHHY